MSIYWYALRSKPRKEDALWKQVKAEGFEAFYPRLKIVPTNPRSRKLIPYFPGYLFVHIDMDLVGRSTFVYMPYSSGLVEFGGEPAIVPDHLIYTLQKRIEESANFSLQYTNKIKHGEIVVIQNGPFRGFEAIFDSQISGDDRVRVLLELIFTKRQIPVELKVEQIERKR